MTGKLPVITLVIILMTAITINFAEFFVPLSANFQFRAECRKTLLAMEEKNQLSAEMRNELQNALADRNFTVISISAPHTARRGQFLNLQVVADYKYSKLTGIFKRKEAIQRMEFNKYAVARKVLN